MKYSAPLVGFLLVTGADAIALDITNCRDTIIDGRERAPEALNLLFDGGNVGKLIVKIADPPLKL